MLCLGLRLVAGRGGVAGRCLRPGSLRVPRSGRRVARLLLGGHLLVLLGRVPGVLLGVLRLLAGCLRVLRALRRRRVAGGGAEARLLGLLVRVLRLAGLRLVAGRGSAHAPATTLRSCWNAV
ncbi:hypothetical protein GCM10009665_70090 [Kitasatospora nipponensis]|uniref:Uncharacterized protein n=1 Tax=Kitasatospora nipponensis TaxID=258049 RepID=A0ABN1X4S3_9ACTN